MAQSQILTKLFRGTLYSNLARSFIRESNKGGVCWTRSMIFHRWKHSIGAPSHITSPISFALVRCSYPEYALKDGQNVRLFHTQQCLQQKGDQPSEKTDSDVDYIEKELEVETKAAGKKKQKQAASDLQNSMINVGKFVPDKILELIDEDGTSLGTVNRSQAVALSREKKLKLVLLKPSAKPWPLYKLMTGQELHEEQVKRNEKKKKTTAPTQVRNNPVACNISDNALNDNFH